MNEADFDQELIAFTARENELKARIAELERDLQSATDKWKEWAALAEGAEAACNQNIKRIAELEGQIKDLTNKSP